MDEALFGSDDEGDEAVPMSFNQQRQLQQQQHLQSQRSWTRQPQQPQLQLQHEQQQDRFNQQPLQTGNHDVANIQNIRLQLNQVNIVPKGMAQRSPTHMPNTLLS